MKLTALLGTLVLAGAAIRAYARFARPWVRDWGARPDEVERALPGDAILDDVALQTTRAISVDATPADIWPWIVQMGPRPRGGVYTYDWIERLLGIDIENTDRILPQFQDLEPGEFIGIDKKGHGIQVREVRPEEALVLQWLPARSTWTFALYPQAGGTRLISRNRLPGSGLAFWAMVAFMEPASLVMERKMLQGIKRRAERLAEERRTSAGPA